MKKLLFMGGLMMWSFLTVAQFGSNKPEVIRGVLFDKATNVRLEAAVITVDLGGYTVSSMTDAGGYFTLFNIPRETATLRISMSGYEDKIISNIQKSEDVEYHIGMEPKKLTAEDPIR